MIGLPRSRVEMLNLSLPPASDAELVEMVRNEVMRQLTDLPEDAIVDFHIVQGDAESLRRVEAAVLRPETAAQIHAACAPVGQLPAQMVLRPLAIASLFTRLAGRGHNQALLLTVMDCDADMSLFSHGQVVFSRTVRLMDEETGPLDASRVSDEIRRTLAVAPLEPQHEEDVGHIYMFDDLKRANEFIEQLADELQLPVSLLDPLVGLKVAKDVDLEHIHRFPALIGMVPITPTSQSRWILLIPNNRRLRRVMASRSPSMRAPRQSACCWLWGTCGRSSMQAWEKHATWLNR